MYPVLFTYILTVVFLNQLQGPHGQRNTQNESEITFIYNT